MKEGKKAGSTKLEVKKFICKVHITWNLNSYNPS